MHIIVMFLITIFFITCETSADIVSIKEKEYTIYINGQAIKKIPYGWNKPVREAKTRAEITAFLIEQGHIWFKQIRDAQDKTTWYLGWVEPNKVELSDFIELEYKQDEYDYLLRSEVHPDKILYVLQTYGRYWPWTKNNRIVLILNDGRYITSEIIIATKGLVLEMNPYRPAPTVCVVPFNVSLRYMDIMRIRPNRQEFRCSLFIGFPRRFEIDGKRQKWNPKNVESFKIVSLKGDEK